MNISYTVKPADMGAFFAHNRRHNAKIKRARCTALVRAVIVSLIYAFIRSPDPRHEIAYFLANFLIVGSCTWFLGDLFLRVKQWHRFRKKDHTGLFCEHTITLTDDALIEVTPVNEATHPWSTLHSVIDSKKYIFIFVFANAAHIIPKHAFPSVEASHAFFLRARELFDNAHPPWLTQ